MYQQDPLFDELLRKPMMMASQNDDYDEDEDEEEEDLFGDDIMAALQAEKDAESAEAEAYAASLLGGEEGETEAAPAEPVAPPPPPKEYTLPGIWRHLWGYRLITLFGFVPLALLAAFVSQHNAVQRGSTRKLGDQEAPESLDASSLCANWPRCNR